MSVPAGGPSPLGTERLSIGTRVRMTKQCLQIAAWRGAVTGVVAGMCRDADKLRVRRDGQRTSELWWRDYWEAVE